MTQTHNSDFRASAQTAKTFGMALDAGLGHYHYHHNPLVEKVSMAVKNCQKPVILTL